MKKLMYKMVVHTIDGRKKTHRGSRNVLSSLETRVKHGCQFTHMEVYMVFDDGDHLVKTVFHEGGENNDL